jgi:uncharacterized protein YdeI (YjbR/CyaY-like superfamily)
MKPRFFKTPSAFHEWLARNHDTKTELWIGFHKKASGKPSVTYHEALDEALCFGWIDGVRKRLNHDSYVQRFSPRKAKSTWSNINTKRAEELKQLGKMQAAGLKALAARDPKRSGIYSFEREELKFEGELKKRFQANKKAWQFYQRLPPSLKRTITFWVISAKKLETRWRRLDRLIESLARGVRPGIIDSKSNATIEESKTR